MNEQDTKRLQGRIPHGYWTGIDIGPGWDRIVLDLDEVLSELDPDYVLLQVKEKFGGLRYYAHPSEAYWQSFPEQDRARLIDSTFHQAILDAETASYKTCEKCGQPGVVRDRSWLLTLCDDHAEGAPPMSSEFRKTFTGGSGDDPA